MDADQFRVFMEQQNNLITHLMANIATVPAGRQQPEPGRSVPVPQPAPLSLEGDMAENYEFFESSWDNYSKAIGMDRWPATENGRKVNILLTVVGEKARKKFFNFELTEQQQADPTAALAAIKAKVVAKRNVIVDRLDFFSATQSSDESIDDFSARLKALAKLAKLGALEKELLAYKVVTSNKWTQLRTKMLTIEDIDLEKAVDLCRAEEIAAKRSHELGSLQSTSEVKKVHKGKGQRTQKTTRCKFCGDPHEFVKGACPALGKRCHRCHGKNHFEKVCKSQKKTRKPKKVKAVQEDSDSESDPASAEYTSTDESDEEYEISKIYDYSNNGGCVLADIDLKFNDQWKSVLCELDTGANTSLIGHGCLKKLFGFSNATLLPSKIRLQSFGGNPINVLGQVKIPCRRSNKKFTLVLQVVDVDHRPLLSAKASRELGLVKFCNTVSFVEPKAPAQTSAQSDKLFNIYRVKAQRIVDSHQGLFSGYGKLPGLAKLEIDESITPSIQPPRRVPIAMRGKLKDELEVLEKDGIIVKEMTHTDWVSNIVIVQRGSGFRICLDPVLLNRALKRPNLQFVTLDEVLPELGKARVFSTIDAKKGFWHVVLDEESSKLTTFWTPFGRYRWTRLPFGVAPAPEIFQIKLQEVIQGLRGVECIADDLLVFGVGDTLEQALADHNGCLEKLLCRLELNNVRLNKSKLKLCERSVKFYGHVLTDQGLKPDESKVAAIRDFPQPRNRKEVHRFVGMVTYLGRFIHNLSANLTNLRLLIPESAVWRWTSVEEKEFQQIKSLVCDIKILRYYDVNQPVTVECDASSIGLGAAVYQRCGVVGYASRTLTPTEKNYAQIEKELLAILFACTRFDQLLVGNPKVTVRTDHKPLINILKKPLLSAPRRLQHMLLNLQRYKLTTEFVTGKDNVVADTLSRAPLNITEGNVNYKKQNIYSVLKEIQEMKLSQFLAVSSAKLDELMQETKNDAPLQQIIRYVQGGWPDSVDRVPDATKIYFGYRHELSTQDGLVFRSDRIVVPHILRRTLIESCHASHNGIEATLRLARANLFWPGMTSEIKNVVKGCAVCGKFAASQQNPPMKSHEIPVHPFQTVSMDVFFAEQRGIKQKFLITVDHYSDFFEVNQLKDLSPESVIVACKQNFSRFGVPQRVITDNGTNFVNGKVVKFSKDWDFELVTSAPHHQQSNGKAEAAVKIAKHLMKKAEESGSDFWFALLHWRNIPNNIGSSPASRLLSRSTRCSVPAAASKLVPKVEEDVPAKIEANRKRTKLHYDRKVRNLPELQIGSPVYVQLNPESSKLWTQGTVTNRYNDRSYQVNVGGTDYRRSLVHLKPRKEPATLPDRQTSCSSNGPSERSNSNVSAPTMATEERETAAETTVCKQPQRSREETSTPAEMTSTEELAVTPITPQSEKQKRNRPSTPKEVGRPKRATKIPANLRDYQLKF